jgi:hypothetical protein
MSGTEQVNQQPSPLLPGSLLSSREPRLLSPVETAWLLRQGTGEEVEDVLRSHPVLGRVGGYLKKKKQEALGICLLACLFLRQGFSV